MKKLIAVIFDFDDTLAPDSTTGYLASRGVDINAFWKKVTDEIRSGWDPVPAYLYEMIQASFSGKYGKFTKESFEQWGKNLPLNRGILSFFSRIRKYASEKDPEAQIEFYCISSGIGDILRSTRIAGQFSGIWASEFHYSQDGAVSFPSKIISFTDKTRYIFQISKGFTDEVWKGNPFCVNMKVKPSEIRIPFENMIFVGDGMTDIPCFSLVMKNGGKAIGVYDGNRESKWGTARNLLDQGRVMNLVTADYSRRSDLSNSIMMAVSSVIERIQLKS